MPRRLPGPGGAETSLASSRSSPSRSTRYAVAPGAARDDLGELGALEEQPDAVVGRDARPGSRSSTSRGTPAGAAPRRRSAGTRCRRGSRARRACPRAAARTSRSRRPRTSRSSRRSSRSGTTPGSHASRRIRSKPCTRQIASMFAVLPPPTKITSCASTSSRRSSGGHGKNVQVRDSPSPREPLVEADDRAPASSPRSPSARSRSRGRSLPGSASDLARSSARVCSSVSPAAPEAHDPPLRHRARVYGRARAVRRCHMEIGYAFSSEEHRPPTSSRTRARPRRPASRGGLISDHFHPWIDAQGHSPFVWT